MTTAERARARDALRKAVSRGALAKPLACEDCGGPGPLDGHHSDYTKALEVEWLCHDCHCLRHPGKLPPRRGRPPTRSPSPESVERLAQTHRALEEAIAQQRQAERARNAAMRQANAEGWTHSQIARELGLTRARIGQILNGPQT